MVNHGEPVTLGYLRAAEVLEAAGCKFLVGATVYEMVDQLRASLAHDLNSHSHDVISRNSSLLIHASNSLTYMFGTGGTGLWGGQKSLHG